MEKRQLLLLFAITLAGAALRAWPLNAAPLWGDEALSLAIANYSFSQLFFEPVDPTGGLYYAVQKIWLPTGEAPWIVRLPSLLFGIATIPAAFALGLTIGNARTGLWLAFLIAIIPEWIFYSQEARGYALLMLLLVTALTHYVRALRADRLDGRSLLLSAILGLAALYTHLTAWFVIGPLAVYALARMRAVRGTHWTAMWGVAGLVAVLPELVRMARSSMQPDFQWLVQLQPDQLIGLLTRMIGPWSALRDPRLRAGLDAMGVDHVHAAIVATMLSLGVVALLAAVLFARLDWRPKGVNAVIIVVLVIVVPACMYAVGIVRPIILARTLLPFQLGLAILAAILASKTRAWRGLAVVTLLILPELLWSQGWRWKGDWRAMAAMVGNDETPPTLMFCERGDIAAFLSALNERPEAPDVVATLVTARGLSPAIDERDGHRPWAEAFLRQRHAMGGNDRGDAMAAFEPLKVHSGDYLLFEHNCSRVQTARLEAMFPRQEWNLVKNPSPLDAPQYRIYRLSL